MSRIKQLPDNVIDKIAAGEVVERPASVVKELVENSIDAGAKRIEIRIAAGGKQSIVVSDDGSGMNAEDVRMCPMRHATSKMRSPSDLFDIHTLGFRGEALASIGGVSYMTVESRHIEDQEGTRLVIEGGAIRECQAVGRAVGTTISVRQLFFNTPARRKFLRQVDTEARHINQVIIGLAAGYPEVSFTLDHQDRNMLHFTGASRIDRVVDLLGLGRDQILEIDYEKDGVQIVGGISRPEHAGKTKSKQHWLVRGRPIHSRGLTEALYKGYSHWTPEGSHPAFVCWIDLDPKQIDVNVHPAKREIRIANERALNESIQSIIRDAVSSSEERAFKIETASTGSAMPPSIDLSESSRISDEGNAYNEHDEDNGAGEKAVQWVNWNFDGESDSEQGTLLLQSGPSDKAADGVLISNREGAEIENIWQVHGRYLISPLKDALLVVDQQAAHERILYEEAANKDAKAVTPVQQLLFPLVLQLGREEYALTLDLIDLLKNIGFDVRDFGENSIVVDGIPSQMKNWNDGEVLRHILADVADGETVPKGSQKERVFLSYAKHSAVRDGVKLEELEMSYMLKRLMECNEPYFCPRGRPTIVKVLRRDLDRLFGRI